MEQWDTWNEDSEDTGAGTENIAENIRAYRKQIRRQGSILGWSLAAYIGLTLVAGFFFQLGGFSPAASTLASYALVLPFVFLVMRQTPEWIPEKRKMRFGKFVMFFVLIQGGGTIFNFLANVINIFVAVLSGRSLIDMNPINDMLYGLDWMTVAYVTVLGPIVEEYIFRWKLMNHLRPMGEKAAILYSSLVFGLMHGNLSQFFYATFIGIILGYVAVKTGRMKYNCILHIMVNSYSILLVLLTSVNDELGVLVVMLAGFISVLMTIAALVIFFINVRRTWLLPGDWPSGVEYRDFASALYWNPGTIAFAVMCLGMIVYYLFWA